MPVLKPPRLRKGDLIALVAPASPVRPLEKIEGAVRYLEAQGYRVRVGEHVAKQTGYLAGTDEERAADFNTMIRDSEVRAIFALRGGYGCGRILDRIDYDALRESPKLISGFSDITGLQLAIYRRCKLVTFSGPMPAVEFWKDLDPFTEEAFWSLVTSNAQRTLRNPDGFATRLIHPGKAAGILLGGNLSLVASAVGTPFCPSFRRALLVLEEVDEAPYRVDRMFAQLRHSRAEPNGLIFGKFTRCVPKDATTPSFTIEQVQDDFVRKLAVPAFAELQHGHIPKKLTVPFGVHASLNAERGELELLEAAVG